MIKIVFMTLLFIALSIVSVSPMKEHSIAQNRFNCREIKNCSCAYVHNDIEIQCPDFNSNVMVKIQPNTYVQVECFVSNENIDIPNLNIGSVPTVQIRRCPLPAHGESLKIGILDRLGIKNTRTLLFVGYGSNLMRKHLVGLNDLERLVLSSNSLAQLPEDLFMDVGNLTWLDLKSNKIQLPPNIFQALDKLEYLELGYNHLENLRPGTFKNQKNLKHLNLWGNKLQNITENVFEGLESITDLDLSANGIETLDANVFTYLVNLSIINLSTNRISSLPGNLFANNKKIKELRLKNNYVTFDVIPSDFLANLTELLYVQLECNISTVPSNLFEGSSNLQNLSLANNKITQLPSDFFVDQINMIDLDLSRNKLVELHDDLFANAINLKVLQLSNNELVNISRNTFFNLKNLEKLMIDNNKLLIIHQQAFFGKNNLNTISLANNQLTFIDKGSGLSLENYFLPSPFQDLHLKTLILRNNSISYILPDWVNSLELEHLDLQHNNISKISYDVMQFLARNIVVDLRYNQISEINLDSLKFIAVAQDDINDLPIVKVLLDNNPVYCDCFLVDFVKYFQNKLPQETTRLIDIDLGSLKCVGPDRLQDTPIKNVDIMDLLCPLNNKISECPSACSCWARYADTGMIVNCSNAELINVPKIPPLSSGLNHMELYIENNNITELPNTLSNANYISHIFAQNNQIKRLTAENIPRNLTTLIVTDNQLTQMNTSVLNIFNNSMKLININLGNNPWSCGCEVKNFYDFILSQKSRIENLNQIKCKDNKILIRLKPQDFCPIDNTAFTVVSIIIFIIIATACCLLVGLYFKYEVEIKVYCYNHNLLRKWVTEDEIDKDKKYDAFVSFAHQDDDFITDYLRPKLEDEYGFKLNLHFRDWVVGGYIPEQIIESVQDSRRTIIVLSSHFLESIWGQMEFRVAHHNAITEGRGRVIIIIYGDIENTEKMDTDLKAYLKMNTYIKWGDPWFWDRLLYALPHKQGIIRKKSKGLIKNALKNSIDDKLELIKPSAPTSPLTTPPAESANHNPLITKLNCDLIPNGKIKNGINGHVNGAFIINTNAKQSDV